MTTATADQLALVLDPLRDDLEPAEVAAVEAKVAHDDLERGRHATPAPACSCTKPWGDARRRHCLRCGRDIGAPAT